MISSFIGLFSAFALLTPLVISHWAMAQIENTTLPENMNDIRQIIDLKDDTVTLINKTTNETISIRNLSEDTGNMTTNETLAGDTGNMTTNETLSPTTGNITTKVNLTEKFRELGK
jgi:hypothetical protein